MTLDQAKIITVLSAERGQYEEKPLHETAQMMDRNPFYPVTRSGAKTIHPDHVALREADMATWLFPDALRDGLRYDLFSSYNGYPATWDQWVLRVPSNKQQEEYYIDVGIGLPPAVAEGAEFPLIDVPSGTGVLIKNVKYGFRMGITHEMIKYDRIGIVRDVVAKLGRAHAFGRDQACYNVLTTTANYARNSTTGDNDVGANTQTLTFSPAGLNTALTVLRTMKDRKSGAYLGVMPDTLIVTPRLELAVRQLIQSSMVTRVGGNTTNEVYGGGTNNPFFGIVRNIIVSPLLGANYEWALMEARRAVVFQDNEPLSIQMQTEGDPSNNDWLNYDRISYRTSETYGVGMKDDRFAFFSDSTTAPTLA